MADDVQTLQAAMQQGFADIRARIDDLRAARAEDRDTGRQMHRDNTARMDAMAHRLEDVARDCAETRAQATATNGRVNRHDDQIAALFERLKSLLTGRPSAAPGLDLEKQPLSIGGLKLIVGAVVVTISLTVTVLLALGWHK